MNDGDYRRHDATGLAGLISRGEVSASEVVERATARIEALNPALNVNAVNTPLFEAAPALGRFFDRHDVLLTPTLANPPLPLGAIDMQGDDWDRYLEQLLNEVPFTSLFNAAGAPAASVPLGRNGDGMPIGVHIGAALGEEGTLLRLAREMERAAPWHERV